jgi:hypothetical protein
MWHVRERTNIYKTLAIRVEGKRIFRIHWNRLEDNIKLDLQMQ